MNEAEQNAYLLGLLKNLYLELGIYLTFAELVKQIVGQNEVDDILAKVRRDPDLAESVASYLQVFSLTLSHSAEVDPDLALQAFLSQWRAQGKPN
ncbi:MAG: hypothetical protein WBE72_14285 [Terracidiphilus sp.]